MIDRANGGLLIARQSGLSIIHRSDGGDYVALDAYQTLVDELYKSGFMDIIVFGFYYVNPNKVEKSQPYP